MSLLKFTPHMLKNQPDQTAYLLNKLVSEGVGTGGGEGGKLYPGTGQHTDGAMTQKATTDALSLKANSTDVNAALAGKVDKVSGKGLSSNDFTDEDQTKLNGIEAGAQVNVQSDWDQTNTSADDYIKNKPTIPVIPTNLMTTDTAQTVTGAKTFHNAEIATDNMITLKNNSTSLIRGMSGIEYRQLLKRGSTDVEVGNAHDPLALKGSGARPKYNSTNLLIDSDLDDVVFVGTGSVGTLSPWVDTSDLVDGAVTTAKIADGAVTAEKFAQYAVNNAVRTSGNLAPTSDTPSYWINLFGTPGYYVTGYSGKSFTDQPTNYGVLETIFRNSGSIIQRYTSTVNNVYIRTGDLDGWHGVGSDSSFAQIINTNVSTGTFSMSSGFAEVSNRSFIKKVGNLVTWQLFFTATSAMSAGTEYHVGTISSGFRPPQLTLGSGSVTNGVNIGSFVDEDGKIRLIPYANVASNSSRYVGGTYFVN